MRLDAFFLRLALPLGLALPLVAQEPALEAVRALPWQNEPAPPWQPLAGQPDMALPAPATPARGRIKVHLEGDGALRVLDPKGVRTLRVGLPGRPLRAWRDGGLPLALGVPSTWSFPEGTPLAKGLGYLAWGAADFRSSLEGLLWILDDGEALLTVVNPATGQILYMPLPLGSGFDLDFQPDRLILRAAQGPPGLSGARAWALPWLAMLPQLARLGPPPQTPKPGTALAPFRQ